MAAILNLFKKKQPDSPELTELNDQLRTFRGNCALQRVTVGLRNPRTWKFYDQGDDTKAPIIILPPSGGTPECFCKLFNDLPEKGIRLIAVQSPPINDHDEWLESFSGFLDHIKLKKAHILGCGLGGFLGLLYTRVNPKRVLSIILINSYATNINLITSVGKFEFSPAYVIKDYLTRGFEVEGNTVNGKQIKNVKPNHKAAVDFFKAQMGTLSQEELYSSVCLQSTEAFIDKRKVDQTKLTIIECDDFSSFDESMRATLPTFFKNGRYVGLKEGGDFPFLSCAEDISLHITVHMRRLDPTLLEAIKLETVPEEVGMERGMVQSKPADEHDEEPEPSPQQTQNAETGDTGESSYEYYTATATEDNDE
ncbi:putative Maspardin [Blattamonas nauphoetae]|uniref:Maspardin n=1 Tax=Blattamonas nauphoetae TaxID=2049346 RepID=A0ABQ9XN99_9EUKA|nr:putative Maspardin [Blattamonas nauphoetae]